MIAAIYARTSSEQRGIAFKVTSVTQQVEHARVPFGPRLKRVLVAGALSLNAACGGDPLRAVSLAVHQYQPERHGKFATLCLSRTVGKYEEYEFELLFETAAGRRADCNGVISSRWDGEPGTFCRDYNLLVYCLGRASTQEERITVSEHIAPGMVKRAVVRLFSHRNQVGEWTFGPL
jgi:hypothetical protein